MYCMRRDIRRRLLDWSYGPDLRELEPTELITWTPKVGKLIDQNRK